MRLCVVNPRAQDGSPGSPIMKNKKTINIGALNKVRKNDVQREFSAIDFARQELESCKSIEQSTRSPSKELDNC